MQISHISASFPLADLPSPLAAALRDRYTLERELGRGGMATVYLARDLKHGRAVALKVLSADLVLPRGAERFQRDARVIEQRRPIDVRLKLDDRFDRVFLESRKTAADRAACTDKITKDINLSVRLSQDFRDRMEIVPARATRQTKLIRTKRISLFRNSLSGFFNKSQIAA